MVEEEGGGEGAAEVGDEVIAKFDGHEGVETHFHERLALVDEVGVGEAEDAQGLFAKVLDEESATVAHR